MKKIGIIFAMEEELRELLNVMELEREYSIFDLKFYECKLNDLTCILVESGVGKVNAARTCQILIDNMSVDFVFNIGVAGGVSEMLSVGDIVIVDKLVQHDFDITAFNHPKGYIPNVGDFIKCDDYLVYLVNMTANKLNIPVLRGTIASGDIFCTDPKMSEKSNKKFSALCVEMEGASIGQVCYLSHVPCLIIRCISDTPNNNNVITYEEFLESSSRNVAHLMLEVLKEISVINN